MRSLLALSRILATGAALAIASVPASAGTYRVLYSFQTQNDGANPIAGLVDFAGTLYGTTQGGGAYGQGTVFSLNSTTGIETVVHSFGQHDGRGPVAGLVEVDGMLYGAATRGPSGGGFNNCPGKDCGLVFSLDPATGAEKILYAFQGGKDGIKPYASLIDIGGTLYGTTLYGGNAAQCSHGCGTVFSFNPRTGSEQTLYSFQGGSDGALPEAGLTEVNNKLYGTTFFGGSGRQVCKTGCGTVFSLDLATGIEKIEYAFQGRSDGGRPRGSLIKVGATLFGTTLYGGDRVSCIDFGCGIVFQFDPRAEAQKVVYTFHGNADGHRPEAGLTELGGLLYGTTYYGGTTSANCYPGCGAMFSFDPTTGAETIVYNFQGAPDGAGPKSSLLAVGGTLYGTTYYGGTSKIGTVFAFSP